MMNSRLEKFLLVCFTALGIVSSANAQLAWNINYTDASGTGFLDPTFGTSRQAVINSVTNQLASILDARGTVTIKINTTAAYAGYLGQAGTSYFTNTGYSNGILFQQATTNSNSFSSQANATFYFGNINLSGTNYSLSSSSAAPTSTQFDLYSVALHEFTHTLGFTANTSSSGTSLISGSNPGAYTNYAHAIRLGATNGTPEFGTTGNFIGNVADLTSGNLYFYGTMTLLANGGNPVQLYAPTTFTNGSSLSHIDPTGAGLANALMQPSLLNGVERRQHLPVEIAMLVDMGWNNFNWNGNTANWGDNTTSTTNSPWLNVDGDSILSPVGTITPNMILRFSGSGSSSYTSTNNLTTTGNPFLLNRIELNSTSTATNILAGSGGNQLRFDSTIGAQPSLTQLGSGSFNLSTNLQIATSLGLSINGTGTGILIISGAISSFNNSGNSSTSSGQTNGNNGLITKSGAFTLQLSGANTYQGGTLVSAGTLLVTNTSGSGTGSNGVTIASGATLGGTHVGGTGNIAGQVTVQSGGAIQLGSTPGQLNFGGGLNLNSGSTFTWLLNGFTSASGNIGQTNGYDQLVISSGNLTINVGASLTLNFGSGISPSSGNAFWNSAHSWDIIHLGGGTNTGATIFGSITNPLYSNGNFTTSVSGGDVMLNFSPVPEPSAILLGFAGLAVLGMFSSRERMKLTT